MAGSISPYFLIVLLVSAFTMPLIFMVLIRNTARYGREPWHLVLKAFAWGAVFSVIIALIFSIILLVTLNQVQPLNDFLAKRFSDVPIIIGALIVAPIVEEAAKALGVRAGRPQIQALLDGLVYGAAAGLGFSARSEEHTSELQSRRDLVCRLLLEKKKKKNTIITHSKKKKKKQKQKNTIKKI